jgi:hypothetical protein
MQIANPILADINSLKIKVLFLFFFLSLPSIFNEDIRKGANCTVNGKMAKSNVDTSPLWVTFRFLVQNPNADASPSKNDWIRISNQS